MKRDDISDELLVVIRNINIDYSIYYSWSSDIFIFYNENKSTVVSKEDGLKFLNIKLRRTKLEKICSKLEIK